MRHLLSGMIPLSILALVTAAGQRTPARSPKPLTIAQVWNLDATYTDAEHGVTFRYPSVWRAETQFGYVPPALSMSSAKPIAGFAYEEGGFPRDHVVGPYSSTTLEGFGVIYSIVPSKSLTECRTLAASLAEKSRPHAILLAGRSFWVYRTSEQAMMQATSGELYATYTTSRCYLFETDVAAASEGALNNVPVLTSAQSHSIDLHLLGIMKSVHIISR